jgi:hypothetical protein
VKEASKEGRKQKKRKDLSIEKEGSFLPARRSSSGRRR